MSDTRRVVFICHGTFGTTETNPNDLLGKVILNYTDDSKYNTLKLIGKNCEEPHIFEFDGSGSDIFSNQVKGKIWKYWNTIVGGIYGDYGVNGISNNLKKALEILKEQYRLAKEENKILELHIFSWSRGGFLALLIVDELKRLVKEGKIELKYIKLVSFDPVVGFYFDRHKFFKSSYQENLDNIKISYQTFYSNDNSLNVWKYVKKFANVNQPFYNPLNFTPHECEDSESILVHCNHDEIVGRCYHEDPHHPGNLGKIVVLGRVLDTTELKFKDAFKKEILEKYQPALEKLVELNYVATEGRVQLDREKIVNAYVGRKNPNLRPITVFLQDPNEKSASKKVSR